MTQTNGMPPQAPYSPRPPQDTPPRPKHSTLEVWAIIVGIAGGVAIVLGWLANAAHDGSAGPLFGVGVLLVAVCVLLAVLGQKGRP